MVHQYKNNGYNIILDVCSGSIHLADDIIYDVVALWDGRSREDILALLTGVYAPGELCEAMDEVEELIADEMLFTEDESQELIEAFLRREPVLKALCLHVAHDCNLACRYCFAGEGEYHGKRSLMSYEVGKQALDLLVASSGSRRNLEVDFFGGEPLMNWDVVKRLVEYGRSLEEKHHKNFRFTLTTNGVLLSDEHMDFCNREMANVVLSLDGRRQVNDRMRPFRSGNGSSYDLILPKFKAFARSRSHENYYVRGTFTRYNMDFSRDVMALADEGFRQISVEPVVGPKDEPYSIRQEDLPILLKEYDRLAAEMLEREKKGRGFNFFHFMIDPEGGPCAYKRLSGCGSGTEYLAVSPEGNIYPCHQFVGQEDFLMGNVQEGIKRSDIRREFGSSSVYTKAECRECFARYYCSGGCAANSWNIGNGIDGVYDIGCELMRKRVECAIMIKVAQAEYEGGEDQI